MTTGSWDRSIPPYLYDVKSWSGADRDPIPRFTKAPLRRVARRDGTSYLVRQKRVDGGFRPPKRVLRDVDHNYAMNATRILEEPVLVRLYPDGSGLYEATSMNSQWTVEDWAAKELLDDNDQLKLIGKLREKTSGSDFNMSVFLGEGHQTLRMVGDTAIRIAKSLYHLKKGDLAGSARSLLEGTSRRPIRPYKTMKPFRPTVDRASSHWLELQYGWLPLLKDAEAGAQFLAHTLSVPASQTYRMSVLRGETNTRVQSNPVFYKPITCVASRTHRRSLKITVTEGPSLIAQLGLLDPELVAWELLPFSFVVDWFLPIGSWLEARAAVSSVSISKTVQTDMLIGVCNAPTSESFTNGTPIGEQRSTQLRRVVLSGPPKVPLPKLKSLGQALSFQHALNGIALLAQAAVGSLNKRDRKQLLNDRLGP